MADNSSNSGTPTAGERHLLYGANVGLLVVVAVAILFIVCYLTTKWSYNKDWSEGGINSLSPRTKQLLKDLDTKGQSFELANLYDPAPNVPSASNDPDNPEPDQKKIAREHAQQVQDLLDEYSKYASDLKPYHFTAQEQRDKVLEVKLKAQERFKDEAKPYADIVTDYDKLVDHLTAFFKAEAPNFGALSLAAGLSDDDKREMAGMQGAFATLIPDELKKTTREVRHSVEDQLPKWSSATSDIQSLVQGIIDQLSSLEKLNGNDQVPKAVQAYLKDADPRYKKMLDELTKYKERIDKLQPLKVDDVLGSIDNDTVVLLGDSTVKVINGSDIYKFVPQNTRRGPNDPDVTFEGEQAISSVLLPLVRPDRPKVVFVGTTPGMTTNGMYSDIADRLSKENFEVSDWAPPSPMNGPDTPPSPPPAEGKGVVWVVLTPDPPNPQQMQMGMPPPDPKPIVDAVKRHLDEGGSAVFLAEANSPMMMGMMGGGGYPYDALVKAFGIAVKAQYSVVSRQVDDTGHEQAAPFVRFNRFPDHPITQSLESLSTAFVSSGGEMGSGAPTVVAVDPAKPSGVDANVIIQVDDQDVYASANFTGTKTKFDPASDLKPPITMGVAATKTGPDPKSSQRVVVLGNKLFTVNQLLEAAQPVMYRGTPVLVLVLPGNAELMVNSVLWASGYQNMIAVGPKSGVALRIKPISTAGMFWIDWGILYLGAPLLVLLTGGIVYAVRRR